MIRIFVERCGARTRKGLPCKAPPVVKRVCYEGFTHKTTNGRCKLHGGKSTGAKTEAGREAIRESNRRRKKVNHPFSGEQSI